MRRDFERLFSHLGPLEPPAGLFDRILHAIKREQEFQHTKWLAFGFLALLIVSFASVPFSWSLFASQMQNSGILYFISTAAADLGTSLALWQDFGLAIAESLPIVGITVFILNMILAVFTVRLFLHRKRLLLGYLIN